MRSGDRLPHVRRLAGEAGLSLYAMSRALHALCEEGVLEARPRRGIRVLRAGGAQPSQEKQDRVLSRWEQVALVLGRRIRDSRGGADVNLIQPKAVRAEFGVSPATARRALESLVRTDILMPQGRGYVPRGNRGYGSMAVLIVSRAAGQNSSVQYESGVRSMLSELEARCARDGVPIEYAFLELRAGTVDSAAAAIRLRELKRSRGQVMAVLSTAGISGDTAVPVCDRLLAEHAALVLLDFSGAIDPRRLTLAARSPSLPPCSTSLATQSPAR